MYKVGLIPDTYDESKAYPNGVDLQKNTITDSTLSINRKAARESFILLQNKDNVLPLANNKKNSATYSSYAVIGNAAIKTSCTTISNNVCYDSNDNRYYEGHLYIGWGSGATDINYNNISEPLEAITNKVVNDLGGSITSSTNLINKTNNYYEEDLDSVPSTINGADVIIVFIMASSGEDTGSVEQTPGDRLDFNMWHKEMA